PCAGDYQLVILGQFIHSQNRDDVLQVLVSLKSGLHTSGNFVVLVAHDLGVENTGRGIQRIHRRINPQLRQRSRKNRGGIQVSEGRRRGRIGQVIGGN